MRDHALPRAIEQFCINVNGKASQVRHELGNTFKHLCLNGERDFVFGINRAE